MSIGLEFVKEIDEYWGNHVRYLDCGKEDDVKFEKIYTIKENKEYRRDLNIENEKFGWGYWKYWRKRYSILR